MLVAVFSCRRCYGRQDCTGSDVSKQRHCFSKKLQTDSGSGVDGSACCDSGHRDFSRAVLVGHRWPGDFQGCHLELLEQCRHGDAGLRCHKQGILWQLCHVAGHAQEASHPQRPPYSRGIGGQQVRLTGENGIHPSMPYCEINMEQTRMCPTLTGAGHLLQTSVYNNPPQIDH